jgi:signal transduction histidine kinase
VPDRSFALPRPTPWYRWIGPWPFRPVVTFFLSWYFFIVTSTGQLLGQGSVDPGQWFVRGLIFGAPGAAVIALVLYVGRRWQSTHGVRPAAYVAFIFFAAAIAVPLRSFLIIIPFQQYANVPGIALAILRLMLMLFVIMAVSGAVVVRLQQQVNATQRALQQVRDQQRIMVEADEAARRQIATLLHDRVQAGLIAACLELQMIAQREGTTGQQELRAVIDRLEQLRALDVRRAARALSPSLEDIDLKSALEELAAQYEPSIETRVHVTPMIEERRGTMDEDLPIAIYRIVEQALLNAGAHGHAQHVWIDVEATADRIDLSVRDDGQGLPLGKQMPGLGSAVMETWTRVHDGSWSLSPSPHGGAVVRAVFPYSSA